MYGKQASGNGTFMVAQLRYRQVTPNYTKSLEQVVPDGVLTYNADTYV
jgi:hypothetical protein